MTELGIGQERPAKRARLSTDGVTSAAGRGARCSPAQLTGMANTDPAHRDQKMTAAPKRKQSAEHGSPKKMRSCCGPAYSSDVLLTGPCVRSLDCMAETGARTPHQAALEPVLSGGDEVASPRHRANTLLFRTRGCSTLRSRTSPYHTQETAGQRRAERKRVHTESSLQHIERTVNSRRDPAHTVEETRRSFDVEAAGAGGLASPPSDAVRPVSREVSDESSDRAAARDEDETKYEPETENEEVPRDSQASGDDRSDLNDSKTDLVRNELAQLRDDFTDSQTMVRNLRQINGQYAEQIECLNIQISLLEVRHAEDQLISETQSSDLQRLRAEYSERAAEMSARVQRLDRQRSDAQSALSEQRAQLSAVRAQLQRLSAARCQERGELEQLQAERCQEQQELDACRARLHGLSAGLERQRECLECSICLEVFRRPVTLGCGHTFCTECIETNRRAAVLPQSCPLCRQYIGAAAQSAVLSQLVEMTHELERWRV